MQSLGLCYQLGHGVCETCPHPAPRQMDFVVVAENGHHAISLNWCACPGAKDRFEQLLDVGWWPATQSDPDTAFTISGLRRFHLLNLQAKVPPTDYYRALEQLTTGDGLTSTVVSCFSENSKMQRCSLVSNSTVYQRLCWQSGSGGTSKCASALDVVIVSQVLQALHPENWQSNVVPVLYPV